MSDAAAAPEGAEPRSFNLVLVGLQGGAVNDMLSRDLQEMVKELVDHWNNTRKTAKGCLTLKLKLKFDDGICEIVPEVKVELPKPVLGRDVMWPDQHGNLRPENPRQHKLPLRHVDDRADMREV